LGFIPNLIASFANNLTVLPGCLPLQDVYERRSFIRRERQIVLLATSVRNDCSYCTAALLTIAKAFLFTSAQVIVAVVNNTPVPDIKLNDLVTLVKLVREDHISPVPIDESSGAESE
jgi:hypothetical protein